MGRERRKYARIDSEQVISYSLEDDAGKLAVSSNLSVGGLQFQVIGCEINYGEVLRVTFSLEDQAVQAVGKVAWATEVDAFTTEVGLEFIHVEPDVQRALEDAFPES